MKRLTILKSGQAFILEGQEGDTVLLPVPKWLEEQVALREIVLAFELLFEHKDIPRYHEFFSWLIGQLQLKYGNRWSKLFEAFLASPEAGRFIAKMEIDDILNEERG